MEDPPPFHPMSLKAVAVTEEPTILVESKDTHTSFWLCRQEPFLGAEGLATSCARQGPGFFSPPPVGFVLPSLLQRSCGGSAAATTWVPLPPLAAPGSSAIKTGSCNWLNDNTSERRSCALTMLAPIVNRPGVHLLMRARWSLASGTPKKSDGPSPSSALETPHCQGEVGVREPAVPRPEMGIMATGVRLSWGVSR